MRLHFTKMEATGNDYIYFDCLEKEIKGPERVSKMLSKRHFSVGADGIVLICPSKIADAKMRIFNADGTEGKMCGNAARCVGKLLFESNFARRSRISLETEAGVRELFLTVKDGKIGKITVDMGVARIGDTFILEASGEKFEMREVDMGNPHQVAFSPDADYINLEKIGRACEQNPRFLGGVNTEFCEILGKNHLKVRVFERGSGETLSCGTGACASAAAAVLSGECERGATVRVLMRGGELAVRFDEDMRAYLTGDAQMVFEGRVKMQN